MCFKFYEHSKSVTYRDIRVYKKTEERSFGFFLRQIDDSGGYDVFTKRADDLIKFLDEELIEFMNSYDYGISLFSLLKNFDVLDPAGDIVFRGSKYNLKRFLEIRRLEGTEFWDIHLASFWDDISSSKTFDEAASRVLNELGFVIKASENGFGPDFRLTPDFLFKKNGHTHGDIRIKMTGSRQLDYDLAFKQAGLDPLLDDTTAYTWHHLDDFNPETGECTMQLVRSVIHNQVQHAGGVSMWSKFYLVPYAS